MTDADAERLRHAILKHLMKVGSHGMLQKHLFERLPPKSMATLINAMTDLRATGLAVSCSSTRHTTRWGLLWTITDAGKRHHLVWIAEQARALPEIQAATDEHAVMS
jgi:hypothetical protein